ncbi:MAG: DHA2 family efflux MFS transporter permease subunit [Rhodospirillales bacterium]
MTPSTLEQQINRFGPAYKWLVTFAGLLGAMAMILSATMVNVAVPSIMGAFGVGQDLAQWASTAFLATMVASQLLNAWLVSAFGQRFTFNLTLVVFTLGAVVSSLSPNIEVLIIGRIMQGFSAGVIQPLVMATIISVFPPDRRGFTMGLYGMGVTLAPSFGPLVGGITIDLITWRHIFLAPLPLIAISFAMGSVLMPSKKLSLRLPEFDWTGFFLLSTALICLMAGVGNGQRWGWESDGIFWLLGIGLISAIGFIYAQSRTASPLLNLSLYLKPRFAAAMVIAFIFGAGNFASNYVIPVFAQTVQGFSATAAGLVLMPAGLLLVLMIPFSGRLADRVPEQYPIMVGVSVFALAAFLFAGSDTNTPFFMMALFAIGSRLGLGLVMPNMGSVAMKSIPMDQLNQAAGAYNFTRQLGGAFGVNAVVVVIERRTAFHADAMATTQTSANSFSSELMEKVERLLSESGVPEALHQSGALEYLQTVIQAQAWTIGFQESFLVISMVFVAALVPAWLLRSTKAGVTG